MELTPKYNGGPTKTPKLMVTYSEKKKLNNMPVEEQAETSREMIGYDPYKNGRNPKGEAAKRQEEYYNKTVAKQNMSVVLDVAKRDKQEKAGKMPDAPLIRSSDKVEEDYTQKALQKAALETDPNKPKKGYETMANQSENRQIKFKEEAEEDKKKNPTLTGGFKKGSMGMR